MPILQLNIKTPEEMIKLGEVLGHLAYPNMVIALNGNLGAGKTTLTKGIGKALNIKEIINSPTFTIMKIYQGSLPLYHLDVYRITDVNSDFELEEYFEMGGVSVIEWATQIEPLLPSDTIRIDLLINEDTSRTASINASSELLNAINKEMSLWKDYF